MLIHKTHVPQLGDVEVKTVPGAAPVVFVNGVIQHHETYSIYGPTISFDIPQKVRWQAGFAWYPVCVKGYWFTTVYRRRNGAIFYGDDFDRLQEA